MLRNNSEADSDRCSTLIRERTCRFSYSSNLLLLQINEVKMFEYKKPTATLDYTIWSDDWK